MTIVDTLKELFSAQAEKIKEVVENTKKDLENTFNGALSEHLNQVKNDYEDKIKKLEEKLAELEKKDTTDLETKVQDFENKIKEIENKLNQDSESKTQEIEDLKNKIKGLEGLLGLDNIDKNKLADADNIDEVLINPKLRFFNPTVYDFLDANFSKIKEFLLGQNSE